MYLGRTVENDEIESRSFQAVLFYLLAALSFMYWFSFVMYWRAQVDDLVEIIEETVDPLSSLDKIPILKRLVQWCVRQQTPSFVTLPLTLTLRPGTTTTSPSTRAASTSSSR